MSNSRTLGFISLLLANFRSLIPKQDELTSLIDTCACDIVLGTETWLCSDISNAELALSMEFTIYRNDRLGRRGGGVILAVKKHIPSSLITIDSTLEIIWVRVGLRFKTCVIGVCYRPPESPVEFIDNLNDALDEIHSKFPCSQLILAGDFNYPGIDWETNTIISTCSRKSECTKFIELSSVFQMKQIVNEPTREQAILDLVFTTHPDNASVNVLECLSDHKVVHCQVAVSVDTRDTVKKVISNYAKADHEKVESTLSAFLPNY